MKSMLDKYPRHCDVRICQECGTAQKFFVYSEYLFPPLGDWKPIKWWDFKLKKKLRVGQLFVEGQ